MREGLGTGVGRKGARLSSQASKEEAAGGAGHGLRARGVPPPSATGEAETKPSISEKAYQHLRSVIFARELLPGTLITERKLAERLNASRTPLRAAINRLEGEGLIERSANGGFLVRQVPIDELLEILSIRRLLEGEAAALAAERMSAEEVDALTVLSREVVASPKVGVEDFWDYDDTFHRELARGSGKPLLAGMIEDLRGRARMCYLKTMDRHFGPQASEHLLVLEAIARRDPARARLAMRRHGDKVKERLLKWLARG